ncbi:cilia- and flagella-associated protein 100-like isoform X2 [Hoplias malabaricus]|uniref:cilia- and flagella-associated protein 100-like isoform X2 n=1 Tax=Hoplias malabaricus TaxID=27720 RepID=UPI0034618749
MPFTDKGEDNRKTKNPFLLPTDSEMFQKREADTIVSQQEKAFFRNHPTHMKTTYLSRAWCHSHSAHIRSPEENIVPETVKPRRDRAACATISSKGNNTCQRHKFESVRDYLIKQREVFLLQYSLSVKKETIQKLQKDIKMEQRRINLTEKQLQEEAVAFQNFVTETVQKSEEAVSLAEKQTKTKMEKTAEIKKLAEKMTRVKSEISRYKETLKEYQTCKTFLMSIAPLQWQHEQNQKREQMCKAKMKERIKEMKLNPTLLSSNVKAPTEKCDPKTGKAKNARWLSKCRRPCVTLERLTSVAAVTNEDFNLSDSDEEPALFFSEPKDVLNILIDMEKENLFLIQNFQETEETMKEIQKTVQQMQKKMDNEVQLIQQQVENMQAAIHREREKVSELELKSKMFSYGEYRADKQGHMLNLLHKKVKELYRACLGDMDSNISTLHMLTCIENKAMDVLDNLEKMPTDKVDSIQSLKDREKRMKMREEKAQLKKQYQEERLKLAMERATSDSKKKTGRKLMPRSEPLDLKKKNKAHVLTPKD